MGLSLQAFALRVAVAVAIIGVAILIWQVIDVIVLIFAGVVVAIILSSLSSLVQRSTPLRGPWALALATLALIIVLAALGSLIGWRLADQLGDLSQAVGHAWAQLQDAIQRSRLGHAVLDRIASSSTGGWGGISGLTRAATGTLGALTDLVLILFIGLFLAADPDLYRRGALLMMPSRWRATVDCVLERVVRALQQWLGGVLLSMLIIGVISGLGLWLLGIQLALSLGFLAGLFEFVPYVGPIASAIPAVLIGIAHSPLLALEVIGLYLLVHVIEGYVLVPLIQKRAVALPPALGIVAVVIFGMLFGPLGIMLAHPLMVTVMVVVRNVWLANSATPAQERAVGEESNALPKM